MNKYGTCTFCYETDFLVMAFVKGDQVVTSSLHFLLIAMPSNVVDLQPDEVGGLLLFC